LQNTNNAESKHLFGGLSDFQAAFLKYHSSPQQFAVVSWGCAATSWLARVLNGHPDIYCVHAANRVWEVLGNFECLDPACRRRESPERECPSRLALSLSLKELLITLWAKTMSEIGLRVFVNIDF
jgi:hypothetical protein